MEITTEDRYNKYIEKYEEKAENYKRKLENRKVKKIWQSEFRKKKAEYNKDSNLDYIQKIQAFVDWIYEETGIASGDVEIIEDIEKIQDVEA